MASIMNNEYQALSKISSTHFFSAGLWGRVSVFDVLLPFWIVGAIFFLSYEIEICYLFIWKKKLLWFALYKTIEPIIDVAPHRTVNCLWHFVPMERSCSGSIVVLSQSIIIFYSSLLWMISCCFNLILIRFRKKGKLFYFGSSNLNWILLV